MRRVPQGFGCGDYEARPQACRGFHCLWLTSKSLDDAWRPNKAGFLMYPDRDGKRLNVVVDPGKPETLAARALLFAAEGHVAAGL